MTPSTSPLQLLYCDDSRSDRKAFLSRVARPLEPRVETRTISSPSGLDAIAQSETPVDILVTDLNFETVGGDSKDGLRIMARARERWPDTAVILFTAYPQSLLPEEVLEASEHGLRRSTWVPKIADDPDEAWAHLLEVIEVLVQRSTPAPPQKTRAPGRSLEEVLTWLQERPISTLEKIAGFEGYPRLIGKSAPMLSLQEQIRRVAPTPATVLILGPTGSGKELVARAIHTLSGRPGPFLAVNCGALPHDLLSSELFGHVRGAFTGATEDHPGLFRAAEGGTLFLDEIAELGADDQVKLLRVLQEREVRPVGSTQSIPIDVRVLAATNRDLAHMVDSGTFRQDLHGRIGSFPLDVPPLVCRREDIPVLFIHHLADLAPTYGKKIESVDPKVLRMLINHDWKDNVRELISVVTRTLIRLDLDSRTVRPEHLDLVPHTRTSEIPRPAGGSLLQHILAGQIQNTLSELAREHGKPAVIELVEQTMIHFGGLPDESSTRKLFGMSYRSWQHWAHYNGLTWRKVRKHHHIDRTQDSPKN